MATATKFATPKTPAEQVLWGKMIRDRAQWPQPTEQDLWSFPFQNLKPYHNLSALQLWHQTDPGVINQTYHLWRHTTTFLHMCKEKRNSRIHDPPSNFSCNSLSNSVCLFLSPMYALLPHNVDDHNWLWVLQTPIPLKKSNKIWLWHMQYHCDHFIPHDLI
jgi:hypothetical protein